MTVNTINYENFPQEMWIEVFSHLDFHSIIMSSRVCKLWHRITLLPQTWKAAAKEMGYVFREQDTHLHQALYNFSKSLKLRIESFPVSIGKISPFKFEIHREIKDALTRFPNLAPKTKLPSLEDIHTVHNYENARNSLFLWKALAEAIEIDLPLSGTLDTPEAMIEKAKGFSEWCEQHKEDLQKVKKLNLKLFRLTKLPPQIRYLTNLEILDLSFNTHLKTLPEEMGNLTKLVSLNLAVNLLQELPPWIARLTNLEELDISCNVFEKLPPQLEKFTKLKKLHLQSNRRTWRNSEIENLAKQLPNCTILDIPEPRDKKI